MELKIDWEFPLKPEKDYQVQETELIEPTEIKEEEKINQLVSDLNTEEIKESKHSDQIKELLSELEP